IVEVKGRVNGFGHSGLVTRAPFNPGKGNIVAITDPSVTLTIWPKCSNMTPPMGTVKADNWKLVVNGNPITLFLQVQDFTKIKWGDLGADNVVKSTSIFTTMKKAEILLEQGDKRILISAPSADTPMMGLNHEKYKNGIKMVSNASRTMNCFVTMDNCGIMEGLMTTVQAIIGTQKTMNGPFGKLWCDSCEALQNINPASTCVAKAVGKVIPELQKLTGITFHVPTANVLVVDLMCHLEKCPKYDDIKKMVKQALEGPLKGILDYPQQQVVSSNFTSDTLSPSMLGWPAFNNYFFKLVFWYDNEFGYSNRVVELMFHLASKG
uniref:glyceraldehyde-3-phosphate dehydrogenase (phosphorylating) n=1 Tax=Chlorocebus sabaeus TaxID=60711 RepID=A0A0D9RM60_CHLSB